MVFHVAVWAFCLPLGMADILCSKQSTCSLQERLHRLDMFFKPIMPVPKSPFFVVKDLGRFVFKGVEALKAKQESASQEGRQYYGTGGDYTTGYATAYPGYNLYGIGGENSSAFNGLDAALSALAFLAFGVWLFNLVLPKFQSAGLGLPGLGRRLEENGGNNIPSETFLSSIFTTSQEFISKIFKLDGALNNKDVFKIIDRNLFQSHGNNITVSSHSDLWNVFMQPVTSLVKAIENILTNGNEIKLSKPMSNLNNLTSIEFIIEPFHSVTSNKTNIGPLARNSLFEVNSLDISQTRNLLTKSLTEMPSSSSNPWMPHRWRREISVGGRGLLQDIVEGVWKPINYLAQLIQRHHIDHHFPNSRTEVSYNEDADGWKSGQYFNQMNKALSPRFSKESKNKISMIMKNLTLHMQNSVRGGQLLQLKLV